MSVEIVAQQVKVHRQRPLILVALLHPTSLFALTSFLVRLSTLIFSIASCTVQKKSFPFCLSTFFQLVTKLTAAGEKN